MDLFFRAGCLSKVQAKRWAVRGPIRQSLRTGPSQTRASGRGVKGRSRKPAATTGRNLGACRPGTEFRKMGAGASLAPPSHRGSSA